MDIILVFMYICKFWYCSAWLELQVRLLFFFCNYGKVCLPTFCFISIFLWFLLGHLKLFGFFCQTREIYAYCTGVVRPVFTQQCPMLISLIYRGLSISRCPCLPGESVSYFWILGSLSCVVVRVFMHLIFSVIGFIWYRRDVLVTPLHVFVVTIGFNGEGHKE